MAYQRRKFRVVEVMPNQQYKVVYTTTNQRFAKTQLDKYRMFYKNKTFTLI